MTWRRALKTPPRKSRPNHANLGFRWSSFTVNHSKSETTKTPGHFVTLFAWTKKRCAPHFPPPQKERDLLIFTFVWDDSFQLALGPSCFLLEKGVTPLKTNVPSTKKTHFKKGKKSSSNFQPSNFLSMFVFRGVFLLIIQRYGKSSWSEKTSTSQRPYRTYQAVEFSTEEARGLQDLAPKHWCIVLKIVSAE